MSPLSLSDPQARNDIRLVKIAESTRAGTPNTLLAHKSIFDADPIDPFFDVFARGLFTSFNSVEDTKGRSIWLYASVKVNEGLDTSEPNQRKRGVYFFTILCDSSQEVVVNHHLTWERLFRHDSRSRPGIDIVTQKSQLRLGERFEIGVDERRRVSVMWWCFGDLNTDLKDKTFHSWIMDNYGDGHPPDEDLRNGNWILGKDPETSSLGNEGGAGWPISH